MDHPYKRPLNSRLFLLAGQKLHHLLVDQFQLTSKTHVHQVAVDPQGNYRISLGSGLNLVTYAGPMEMFAVSDHLKIYAVYLPDVDILFVSLL
jgi:hypothetical protein